MNNKVIPQHEALLEKMETIDLTEADLVKFNKISQEITKINLEKRLYSKSLFENIVAAYEEEKLNELDIEKAVEDMYELNEKHLNKLDEQVESSEELTEKHESLEFDEVNQITVDVNVLNEAYNEVVTIFIDSLDDFQKSQLKI